MYMYQPQKHKPTKYFSAAILLFELFNVCFSGSFFHPSVSNKLLLIMK